MSNYQDLIIGETKQRGLCVINCMHQEALKVERWLPIAQEYDRLNQRFNSRAQIRISLVCSELFTKGSHTVAYIRAVRFPTIGRAVRRLGWKLESTFTTHSIFVFALANNTGDLTFRQSQVSITRQRGLGHTVDHGIEHGAENSTWKSIVTE